MKLPANQKLRMKYPADLHELKDPADELPVHGVMVLVTVEADPAPHRTANDVDQPGQSGLSCLDVPLTARPAASTQLLVLPDITTSYSRIFIHQHL